MKTVISALLILFFCVALSAQPGSLDSSFGTNGKIKSGGTSIATQTDGKILFATSFSQLSVSRFTKAGKIDNRFGNKGTASVTFSQWYWWGEQEHVAVQADGKIIVANAHWDGDVFEDILCVARFNSNGLQDSSFGTNGIVQTPVGDNTGDVSGIIIQSNGKFIVSIRNGSFSSISRIAAIRFNEDGSEDAHFNISFSNYDVCNAMGVQSDGKIVITGHTNKNPYGDQFTLFRFNNNGLIDKSFGVKGITRLHYVAGVDLAVKADDKIIAVTSDSMLIQFQPDGIVDSSFGKNGRVHVSFKCNSVSIQTDGKIIVAGKTNNGSDNDFAAARYLTNGKPDKNFGSNGLTTTDFEYLYDEALDIAIQTDNKIIVTGDGGTARYKAGKVTSLQYAFPVENISSNIILQPNPASNFINITGLKQNYQKLINITDANGLIVYKQITNDNSLRCDVNQLRQGIYYVSVNQNGKLVRKSFIKE